MNQDRNTKGHFKTGTSGNPAGRPPGIVDKRGLAKKLLLEPLLPDAIEKLRVAVSEGEKWAVQLVVTYCLPKPKPIDPEELAEFEAFPLIGIVPMTVVFKNTSVGAYSSSHWIFGDGHTSDLDHPTHIYNETGSYTVTLRIDGVDGSDEQNKVEYIRVYAYQLYVPFVKR